MRTTAVSCGDLKRLLLERRLETLGLFCVACYLYKVSEKAEDVCVSCWNPGYGKTIVALQGRGYGKAG
jgi:hypothetical protein